MRTGVVLVALLLLVLAGCGGPAQPTATASNGPGPTAAGHATSSGSTPATSEVPGADHAGQAPQLHVGDAWTMRTIYRSSSGNVSVNTTQTVTALETLELENVTYETVRIEQQGLGGTQRTVDWQRLSDYARVRSLTSTRIEGWQTQVVRTWTPPCPLFRFPLTVGQTWTVTCHERDSSKSQKDNGTAQTTTGTRSFNVTGTVLGNETVVVPAGTFAAFTVEIRVEDAAQHNTAIYSFAPAACGPVRVTNGGTLSELVAYTCHD